MPSTKVHFDPVRSDEHRLGELEEELVIARVGDALAGAASNGRHAAVEDPREAARRAAVDIATAMLRANSADTAAHSSDVDVIVEGVGRRLGLSGRQLEEVMVAARLHDIGKVGIPPLILDKPGPLDREEWQVIHRHTIIGEQILLAVPELRSAARLVRHSHERWDGNGYPDVLSGEQIPLGSRILLCADAFHAIRSDRPYRLGRSANEALAEIRACAGTQFDPAVVEALEALADELGRSDNGARPRTGRAGRLMALLLIVSMGATSSALARSGLLPEPELGKALPAGAAMAGPLPAQVPGATRADDPFALAWSPAGVAGEAGMLRVAVPGAYLPTGVREVPPGGHSSDAAAGQPNGPPGVRDHGQGVGRGKGRGKGRGDEHGKGHQRGKASKDSASGKRSSRGTARSSSKGAGKGKAAGNGSAHKASAGKGKSSSGSSGSGSSAKPSQSGGVQVSPPPKPPKVVEPPPVSVPPAPPAVGTGDPGGGTGNPSPGSNGSGGSGGHG